MFKGDVLKKIMRQRQWQLTCKFLMLLTTFLLSGCGAKQQFTYRVHLISDLQIQIAPNADHKDSEMTLQVSLLEKDAEENQIVEVSIESIQASMISMHFNFDYDSYVHVDDESINDTQEDREKKFRHRFVGLVGKKYQALVSPKGEVIKLLEVDPRIKKVLELKPSGVSGMLGGDQVKMLLGKESLMEFARLGVAPGAAENKPGEQWEESVAVFVPNLTQLLQTQKQYTCRARERQGGEPVARFEIKASKQADSAAKTAKGGLEVVSLSSSGETTWSLRHGNLKKLSEKMIMEVRYSQGAKTQTPKKGGLKIFQITDKTIEEIDPPKNS
jgi:hypothetical protein